MSDSIKTSGKWRLAELVEELRQYPRFLVRGHANVYGLETWLDQPITNLSVGGVCLAVPAPSAVGDVIRIELLASGEARSVELEGVVRWATDSRMGLEFTCGARNGDVLAYVNATRIAVVPDERDT